MNISEFADIINKEIEIIRYPNQHGRHVAQFARCETKRDIFLDGTYGTGFSPETALADYAYKIRGKTLVFNAMSTDRMEFVVPDQLEA